MKVTMNQQISGTRDGATWPPRGATIDLPDDEAEALIAQGAAVAGRVAIEADKGLTKEDVESPNKRGRSTRAKADPDGETR